MSKLSKLFTYKTGKGKMNILIDMAFHGDEKGDAIMDEVAHMMNEGGFNANKFLKYGNAKKILGKDAASTLRTLKRLL